jgi:acyl-CoA thioesterase
MKTPREIVVYMMKEDSFSKWMGIQLENIDLGYCKIQLTINSEMLNGFRIAHGGISYSLADSALAFAANSRGFQCVSIDTSISHIKKVSEGDVLFAVAREVHRGKTTGIYHVEVTNQNNQMVALFKGTVYITTNKW